MNPLVNAAYEIKKALELALSNGLPPIGSTLSQGNIIIIAVIAVIVVLAVVWLVKKKKK